mmetsp:Transcript_106812/g.300260  ORF Transcript_106812/g.300260 Transcript_106812/m.300260 type:complete len:133 (+) Transcript_106812:200-598(+)
MLGRHRLLRLRLLKLAKQLHDLPQRIGDDFVHVHWGGVLGNGSNWSRCHKRSRGGNRSRSGNRVVIRHASDRRQGLDQGGVMGETSDGGHGDDRLCNLGHLLHRGQVGDSGERGDGGETGYLGDAGHGGGGK